MLRKGDNAGFLDNLHTTEELMEYSYIVRNTHQENTHPGSHRNI